MKRNLIKYGIIVLVMVAAGIVYSCSRSNMESISLDEGEMLESESESGQVSETNPASEMSQSSEGSTGESVTLYPGDEVLQDETFQNKICVYVCGAVNAPDVYELAADERVVDAIKAAGGFSDNADTDYLNLAGSLADGAKIYVPTEDEVAESKVPETSATFIGDGTGGDGTVSGSLGNGSGQGTIVSSGKVNINTATAEELKTLNGIGDKRAQDIINYRSTHEKFNTIEDIMLVPGIKNAVFEKICDYIEV